MARIYSLNSFQVLCKQFCFSTVEYQDYRLSVSFYRLSHYMAFSSERETRSLIRIFSIFGRDLW